MADVAPQERRGRRMLPGDGLSDVDDHDPVLEPEHVVWGEVAVDETGVPDHPSNLQDEVLVECVGIGDDSSLKAWRGPLRVPDKLHHQDVPVVPDGLRGPDAGRLQPSEDRVLASRPRIDQAPKVPNTRLPPELLKGMRWEMAERRVADPVDLDGAKLGAFARAEDAAFLPGRDRKVDRVDETVADHPGDGEKCPVIEELVEELVLVGLLATVLEPFALAREDDVLRTGHERSTSRSAFIGLCTGPLDRSHIDLGQWVGTWCPGYRPYIQPRSLGPPMRPVFLTAPARSVGTPSSRPTSPGTSTPPFPLAHLLDGPADYDAVFRVVRGAVRYALGLERPGLGLGLSNLPPQLGAYWQVTGNLIVMNEGLVETMRAHARSTLELNSFVYVILAHEYLHSLGYLDERAVRQVTAHVTRSSFGPDHVATRMAEGDLWQMFPFLAFAPRGDGRRLKVVPRFDLATTERYIR